MTFDFLNFEQLSVQQSMKLLGGFSAALSETDPLQDSTHKTNANCAGGNCTAGCGKNKKYKNGHSPNTNCGGGKNCVKGCGGQMH